MKVKHFRYQKLLLLALPLITIGFVQSCVWNNEEVLYQENEACDTLNVKYSTHIVPILQVKCYACHSTANSVNDVILDNYEDLKNEIDSDRFWGSINHDAGFSPMPKNQAKMDDCRMSVIRKWIEDGNPNN